MALDTTGGSNDDLDALERSLNRVGDATGRVACPSCGEAVATLWAVQDDIGERVLTCWSGHRFTVGGELLDF